MKKILVIEDSEQNLYLVRFILESRGYEILAAAARTNPLGRNATAEDVANAVLWLQGDGAAFVTT